MSGKTGIQWATDVWNFVTGCQRVSKGCDGCYAFTGHDRRHIAWKRGRWPTAPKQYHLPFSKVQVIPERLDDPLHWLAPRDVFVDSMADMWHRDIPDEVLIEAFGVMAATPQHHYLILTKRPERMQQFITSVDQTAIKVAGSKRIQALPSHRTRNRLWQRLAPVWQWPLPNVWLGVSVEDQEAADARIPLLLQTPAAVRFLSCEPLLGEVDLRPYLSAQWYSQPKTRNGETYDVARVRPGLDWVIIGGESGRHARPMSPNWALSLVEQCRAAGVAVFMKQLGSELGYYYDLKDRHGGDIEAWPPDVNGLRIREFPTAVEVPA